MQAGSLKVYRKNKEVVDRLFFNCFSAFWVYKYCGGRQKTINNIVLKWMKKYEKACVTFTKEEIGLLEYGINHKEFYDDLIAWGQLQPPPTDEQIARIVADAKKVRALMRKEKSKGFN